MKFALRVGFKYSHQNEKKERKKLNMWGDRCVKSESFHNNMDHHVEHFKYLTILPVSYSSIKLE